jgi:hypothetical protein
MPHANELSAEMRNCISNCLDCHAICKETIAHCLMMGGEHASAEHQRIMADCAQACLTSADFMLRMSDYHPHYCDTCADICNACAESCDRLGKRDQTMQKCAELCRRCEQSCRSMAKTMTA